MYRTNNSFSDVAASRLPTDYGSQLVDLPDRQLLDAAPDAMVVVDESGDIVLINRQTEALFGYTRDELLGLPVEVLLPERVRQRHPSHRQGFFDQSRVRSMGQGLELNGRKKDDTEFPVEISLSPIESGQRTFIASSIRDITAHKIAERFLLDSEERYRTLFENASDLIQSVRPDGSFVYVNPAWLTTFGYAENDLPSLNIFDVIHPDDHERCREIFKRVNAGESVEDIEAKFVSKSSDLVLVQGSASPQFEDGVPIATRVLFHNVTVHRKAEEAVELARDMAESATATKSRFLAAASHDLRQPLQSIGLYLSVLNRQEDQSEKGQEIVSKIRSSLDVMGELLDALLDISQLDSGSVTPNKKDFLVQVLLDQVMANNQPPANGKGLALHCARSPCVIHSDPALLQRVVENFVTNAIRYTDAGRIEVHCIPQGDHLRIEVKDTGVGIPAEALATIFEEYFQLDNPVRDRRKGLGLGLSIVKHVARLLDHTLDVNSTPGEGSVFAIAVPIGKPIEMSQDVVATTTVRTRQHQPIVLFVDDDPAIVDATTMLLESAGIEVYAALDGEQAMAHIEAGVHPDLMISDYRLPGDNGVEVVRRVRRATTENLPTVIMTGDTSGKEIEDANLEACTVLHKPVDTGRLISLVENLLSNSA